MYTYTRKEEKKLSSIEPVSEELSMKTAAFNNIYRSKVYTEAVDKYFDIADNKTRNILLAVNEADQNTVMVSLANRLYEHIVEKVDDIDFGTIPNSRGDITKIDNYDQLIDCVNVITEILVNYKQDTNCIDAVRIAIQNVADRKNLFESAYKLNVEMPIIIYNTIVLAIVSSVSYMISSCIEFIKVSDTEGFDIALNKTAVIRTKDCVLYKDLIKFNKLCATGEFDKAMDYVMKNVSKNFTGLSLYGIGSVAMVLGIILLIIPLIRELIFFFYYSRARIADYFDAQATLLTMNAYNIENNLTKDTKDKKEIANKQKKIAEKFKKISNTIAIKTKTGEDKASKEIANVDKKKYKSDEVMDTIPDSANSVLF